MLKAYVTGWRMREGAEIMDYFFGSKREDAAFWDTREKAEDDCVNYDNLPITITSPEGRTHVCGGFTVEERAPNEFVVFCMIPFKGVARGQGTRP
jgi:hypothetical protein